MRKKFLIITLIICLFSTTACTYINKATDNDQSAPVSNYIKNPPDSTSESADIEISNTENTESIENPVENEMQRIEYTIKSAIDNFDWSQEKMVDNLKLTLDIPDYMIKAEDIDNCETYLRYDKEVVAYLRGLVFCCTFKVDNDFNMDESIHSKTNAAGTWNPHTDFEISKDTTNNGYEYVLCERPHDDDYFCYVYIKISDDYIVSLNYWDKIENYEYLSMSINSIKVK